LKTPTELAVVVETYRQGEEKAMSFGGVYDSNFDKVTGLFISDCRLYYKVVVSSRERCNIDSMQSVVKTWTCVVVFSLLTHNYCTLYYPHIVVEVFSCFTC